MWQPFLTKVLAVEAHQVVDLDQAAELVGGTILAGVSGRSVGFPGGQAYPGDWILRGATGTLQAMTDADFVNAYRRAPDASEPEPEPEKAKPRTRTSRSRAAAD